VFRRVSCGLGGACDAPLIVAGIGLSAERPLRAKFRAIRKTPAAMTSASYAEVKVLIVDDSRTMRALLRAMLQAVGIKQIYEAADGESGFADLVNCKPDIVITDLSMERLDGIAFTRKVRQSDKSPDPFVAILMVTGHTERAKIEAARDAGVTEFLAKPITAQGLLGRLAKIVDRPRPFVRCDAYFGPDRRRRAGNPPTGLRRRRDDPGQIVEID
jgi:PleD family two-component response regulator